MADSYKQRYRDLLDAVEAAEDEAGIDLFNQNTIQSSAYPLTPSDGEEYWKRMWVLGITHFQARCYQEGIDPEAYGYKLGMEDHP